MDFRVLGPMEASANGQVLELGPPQQRLVLAALVVDAGRVVSLQALTDRVWDEAPHGARRTLHVYISRLRRLLAQADGTGLASSRLRRRHGGYVLDIDPEFVDLHRFRLLTEQARDTDRTDLERATLLRKAVRLWRGEALSGMDGRWATRSRDAWSQQHVDAVVAWARAELNLCNPGVMIEPLRQLAAQFPLVEPLAAVLMRALYESGRTGEALTHYTRFRQHLVDELGVDPGTELQAVHQAILRGEPTADPVTGAAPAPAPVSIVPRPRQLPRDAAWFTGRTVELERLLEWMPDPKQATAVVISAIDGMAGIGKTALAVHAAHRMVDEFPDGQLFIDLHGYTQDLAPVEPAEALERLLRDLGIAGTQIPASLDARAALYRTRLADQQVLIMLDNAATEAQVTPLLPGSSGCLVLVTSRRRLVGLEATHTLSLDTLPAPDAITLFTLTAGQDRLADQPPDLVAELVQLCGRLPLAIQIAAARLRSHPAWHLADLVQRLRDQQHRLGELEAGQRSVTATLDLSYQHLSPDQQQAYRLLGAHPGVELDAYATAALLATTLQHAGRVLDQLSEAHLLGEPTAGRYRFHDLTRAHAAGDHTTPASEAALGRLLDYYRHTAATAVDTAYPYEREHRQQVPPAPTPSPGLTDPPAALEWLETELPNLLAAARYATERGEPTHLRHLSTTLHPHLRTRGHYHHAETLHQQALDTARAASDQAGQLEALNCLADTYWPQGRYQQAADHYQQALRIARATGHRPAELHALIGLGWVHAMQGRHQQAADHYQQVQQIARTTGHRPAELNALIGLGWVHARQGRHQQAADHYQQVQQIARTTGHRPAELRALTNLGQIHRLHGRHEQAADHYQQALRIARATGYRPAELHALVGLGDILRPQGRHEQAADHYQQALRIARATGYRPAELGALTGLGDILRLQGRHEQAADRYQRLLDLALQSGDRPWQFEAWRGLGRLRHAAGDCGAAIAYYEQALTLADELGQPEDQARAHDGLAHAYCALNQYEQARTHWQHALKILTDLGTDHGGDEETTTSAVRAQLAALPAVMTCPSSQDNL